MMHTSRRGQRGLHRCSDIARLGHVMGRLAKLEQKFNQLVQSVTGDLGSPASVSEWAYNISERLERVELLLFSCNFNQFDEIDAVLKTLRGAPEPASCTSKPDRPTLPSSDSSSKSRTSSPALSLPADTLPCRSSSRQESPSPGMVSDSSLSERVERQSKGSNNSTSSRRDLKNAKVGKAINHSGVTDELEGLSSSGEGQVGCTRSHDADNQSVTSEESSCASDETGTLNCGKTWEPEDADNESLQSLYECHTCSIEDTCTKCRYCDNRFCHSCKRKHCCIDVDGAFDQFISKYFTFSTEADITAAWHTCTSARDSLIAGFHQIGAERENDRRRNVQSSPDSNRS